jgi:hypothetical protein
MTPGKRPPAPSVLQPDEAREWDAIVGALPPDWFARETHPILIQLCRLIHDANTVAAALREVSPSTDLATYGKLLMLEIQVSGCMANLATKMRLTNQSRYATRTAERQSVKARTKPWDVIEGGKAEVKSSSETLCDSVNDDADDDEGTWN